jgi:hypothetical protein
MNDETTILGKVEEAPDSRIGNVSVRAWLAIMLTATVCLMNLAAITAQILHVQQAAQFVLEIKEPLYSGWLLSLGFYFGQKDKR